MKFKIFPELEGEFSKTDFPPYSKFLINGVDNNGSYEYEYELEYPYGTYDLEIMWDSKGKPIEELDLKPLPE